MNKVKISIFSLLLCCGGSVYAQTPQIHGILRGKYEYQPDLEASRFEVRNARLSADGNIANRSAYKLEVDLCDESAIKMKDAWVRVNPVSSLRITLGQQRMPFSIDAHRNPSAQYFANRDASYTSLDFGTYYESNGFHVEAEYLRKLYAKNAFDDCNAFDAMAIYKQNLKNEKSFVQAVSYLLRYDYMDNHSDGKKGFEEGTSRLLQSDAERQRLTAGITFHVANQFFPTDIRLNYEKYWYAKGGTPKESEQDKVVAELMIRF